MNQLGNDKTGTVDALKVWNHYVWNMDRETCIDLC